MKLVIDKNVLHKSLSHILGVVERRNTIPILSNLKITIDSNQPNSVFFTATDMDISITEGLEASTEGEGSFTVPAHILHDIVRKLPDVDITFSYNNDDSNKKLILSANKSRFTLPVLSAEEFPEIAMNDISHTFTIDKKSLSKLLDKSRFAISTEETRYYLNGVYLHHTTANDNRQVLRVVSTDGHRLASIQIDLPDGAADMPSIIVPRKAVFEIRKILEEENNELLLNLEISESKIKLSFNNTILISKLIDGSFPDYTRVIPQDNNITLNTAIKPLNEAIDRVATIASDKSKSIKFSLDNNKITISANDVDAGYAKEEIDVEYKNNKIETGFNSKYLLEMTSVLEGDKIKMHFNDSSSPTLVEDIEDHDSIYVIMPMRI